MIRNSSVGAASAATPPLTTLFAAEAAPTGEIISSLAVNKGSGQRALRRGRVSLAGHAYLITTVVTHRRPVFTDLTRGRVLVGEMRRLQEESVIDSLAWVVMPDHVHWLFVLQDKVSLSKVVGLLKGRSARKLNPNGNAMKGLWQSGFHDHVVRTDESLKTLARYVVANPLRAGLVENIGDYPLWDAVWLNDTLE